MQLLLLGDEDETEASSAPALIAQNTIGGSYRFGSPHVLEVLDGGTREAG